MTGCWLGYLWHRTLSDYWCLDCSSITEDDIGVIVPMMAVNFLSCPSLTVSNVLLNEDECKKFEIHAHSSLSMGQMHKIFFFQLGMVKSTKIVRTPGASCEWTRRQCEWRWNVPETAAK